MSQGDAAEFLIKAEQAEKAASTASGRIAKQFLLSIAQEYRKLAALELDQPEADSVPRYPR